MSATATGMSAERLARIDRFLLSRYIDAGRLPNAQVVVARHGEIAHAATLGLADVARGRALADDAIFRIYSMTKPITSVAFMMLVEEGLVALDEPVSKYIPAWRELGVFDGGFMESFRTKRPQRPMQIVDLLRHTSGLTYGFQQRTNVDAAYRHLGVGEVVKSGTLETMMAALAGLPLEFSPGEAWNYSVSTDVLGYLVGVISGKPFEQFLKERIFDPLGMADTAFHVDASRAARLTACYSATPKGGFALQDDPETSSFLAPPSLVSGGGGLCSTAKDYLAFARMLLAGGVSGTKRLLSPKTIQLMTANHLPGGKDIATMSRSMFSEAAYEGVGFGLGFATTTDPARTLIPGSAGDYFWGGAASTFFWIDPHEDLIVILMTQLMPSSVYPIRRELRTLVYSAFTDSAG